MHYSGRSRHTLGVGVFSKCLYNYTYPKSVLLSQFTSIAYVSCKCSPKCIIQVLCTYGFIHQAADTYVDQLQSCRPEILYPQLVHNAPPKQKSWKIYWLWIRFRQRSSAPDLATKQITTFFRTPYSTWGGNNPSAFPVHLSRCFPHLVVGASSPLAMPICSLSVSTGGAGIDNFGAVFESVHTVWPKKATANV